MRQQEKARCPWAKTELYIQYHDAEWGVPVHDDRLLFEFLVLEGAQAGLSWETMLKKRQNYQEAFDRFDPAIVAKYGQKKCRSLLAEVGIVRNRLKIEAAIHNAKAFLAVQGEIGTFDEYIWGFVGHEPKQHTWRSIKEVPAKTPESDAMSKDLKRRGFTFVGSTICYAFMQAVGMVNDHVVDCFRHGELPKAGEEGETMKDDATYQCDSCGEEILVLIDLTAGSRQEFVEDCSVCCRPNVIHVEIDDTGDVRVWAERE